MGQSQCVCVCVYVKYLHYVICMGVTLTFQEATKYVDEQKMEITMIQFVNAKYKFSDADEDKGAEPEKPLEDEVSHSTATGHPDKRHHR